MFGTFVHTSKSKVNNFSQVLLFTDQVVEILDLEHILDDSASIKVVFLRFFWAERLNEGSNSHLLLGFDLSKNFWLVIGINESQEFVEDFRNGLLVNMLHEIIDHSRLWSENEREELLLLSADQKGDQLAEVTSEDRVKLFISLDEFEKSFKKNEFVSFFFVLLFLLDLSLESRLGSHG